MSSSVFSQCSPDFLKGIKDYIDDYYDSTPSVLDRILTINTGFLSMKTKIYDTVYTNEYSREFVIHTIPLYTSNFKVINPNAIEYEQTKQILQDTSDNLWKFVKQSIHSNKSKLKNIWYNSNQKEHILLAVIENKVILVKSEVFDNPKKFVHSRAIYIRKYPYRYIYDYKNMNQTISRYIKYMKIPDTWYGYQLEEDFTSESKLSFVMVLHDRVGAISAARVLLPDIIKIIVDMVWIEYTKDNIMNILKNGL
jgi:hypothetical protein